MNNNQVKKNWILLIFGLTFSVLFLLGGIIYALDTYDSGYRVDHGQSKDVTIASASGQCHKVINNHPSNDYFIPTKTQAEWDAFAAHLPPGVSIGSCCTSHDHQTCYNNDVYWYDSCGNREEKAQECGTSGYTGSNYCYNNDVYRDYVTRGCSGGSCTQSTSRIKQQECGAAGCSGGSCVTCTSHDHQACYNNDVYWYDSCGNREEKAQECGTSGYTGSNYCYNNDVYRDYVTRGCSGGSCTQSTSRIKQQECGAAGCSGGSCVTIGTWTFDDMNCMGCDCADSSCVGPAMWDDCYLDGTLYGHCPITNLSQPCIIGQSLIRWECTSCAGSQTAAEVRYICK